MPFQSHKVLIPGEVRWFHNEQHYLSQNPTVVPQNLQQRRRCWIRPSDSGSGMDIWGMGGYTAPSTFVMVARNATTGALILVPPTDPRLQYTYSQPALLAIKQYGYFWGEGPGYGVPYTELMQFPDEDLNAYNFSSLMPPIDYPVGLAPTDPVTYLRTDVILVPQALVRKYWKQGDADPASDDVFVISIEDFLRRARPPAVAVATTASRLQTVRNILASAYSEENQLQAIREAVTDYGKSYM